MINQSINQKTLVNNIERNISIVKYLDIHIIWYKGPKYYIRYLFNINLFVGKYYYARTTVIVSGSVLISPIFVYYWRIRVFFSPFKKAERATWT